MQMLIKILTHPYLALVFRMYIGGLFVYASMSKISYSAEFADTIASYQIVPYWAVNITAVLMPWLELVCGFLLIIGVRVKSAALLIGAMLAMFTVAIVINLIRGTKMGCGCFSSMEDEMTWMTVLRDLLWLGMTAHIFLYDRAFQLERRFTPQPAPPVAPDKGRPA